MTVGAWPRVDVLMLGLLVLTSDVWSGGSGLNVAVVVNQSSSNSVELGNYFCERRQVPPQNLLRISWSGSNVSWTTSQVQSVLLTPLATMLSSRGLTPQIDTVVLSMDIPYRVSAGTDYSSTTSVLFYGFKTNNPSDPGPCRIGPTSFSDYARSEAVFRQLAPGNQPGTFLAIMITGNTLADAKATVDRGVDGDGTLPTQTVLLEKTTDAARNVRFFAFDDAILNLRLDGSFPVVRTNSNQTLGFTDLLGLQTGLAQLDLGTGVFVPGAIGDSLTSYAGRLFEYTGQTNLLAFLRAGAAGSYGTVIEPCNYTAKFPEPMVYFYAARGFSLVESYYQSLASPYQGLIVGEPLAAPFRRPGQGGWTAIGPPPVLSGTAALDFSFSAADAHRPLQRVDLFVDGTLHQTVTNCAPAPGNRLSVTLNGLQIDDVVPAGAALADVAANLTDALNARASDTRVEAVLHGDRIELRSTDLAAPGAAVTLATAQTIGSGEALTTFVRASRPDFLDSIARGWRSFEVSGTAATGDSVGVTITKTDGSVVELEVTNGASPVTTVQLTRQLLSLINATASLQGPDGVSAEDSYAQGTTVLTFLLHARSAGWTAAQATVELWASPSLSAGPPGPIALDENLTDLQPRNHLRLTAGSAELATTAWVDTTAIPDGFHKLTLVAYEGSHVATQTHSSQSVRIQNTALSAAFVSSVSGSTAWIGDPLEFTVVANAPDIASIELFGTGGHIATVTGQPTAAFPVNPTSLGLGLHTFHALVTASDGQAYRTESKSIRLVATPLPPTAASLAGFTAQEIAPGHVLVQWRTALEVRLLGFHLERQPADGPWVRVTTTLIPARGGDLPETYLWEDLSVSADSAQTYRLIEVDAAGHEREAARTPLLPGLRARLAHAETSLILSVEGGPGRCVAIEVSANALEGPWRFLQTIDLDGAGAGSARIPWSGIPPVTFFRLRTD